MATLHGGDSARGHELTAMPEAFAQDEESPLNTSSDSSAVTEPAKETAGNGESSVSSASFNFINTIVGAGVIGIPYSIYQVHASHQTAILFDIQHALSVVSFLGYFFWSRLASRPTTACGC